jgi:hypothetical protein
MKHRPVARLAEGWLAERNLHVLYRGYQPLTEGEDFLSAIAPGHVAFRGRTGPEAGADMVREMQALELDPWDNCARHSFGPVPLPGTPLHGEPLGAAGIPFSLKIPVAAGHAQEPGAVVYAMLEQVGQARPSAGWGYLWEHEYVALHRVSRQSIVLTIPGIGLPFVPPPFPF